MYLHSDRCGSLLSLIPPSFVRLRACDSQIGPEILEQISPFHFGAFPSPRHQTGWRAPSLPRTLLRSPHAHEPDTHTHGSHPQPATLNPQPLPSTLNPAPDNDHPQGLATNHGPPFLPRTQAKLPAGRSSFSAGHSSETQHRPLASLASPFLTSADSGVQNNYANANANATANATASGTANGTANGNGEPAILTDRRAL